MASFGGRAAAVPALMLFDRLPSQQADPTAQQRLEQAAAQALERVGFVAAATPAQADVLVQPDSRFSRVLSPFADPWLGPSRRCAARRHRTAAFTARS